MNKAQKRLYLLRQLKQFKLTRKTLIQFSRSAFETIHPFSILYQPAPEKQVLKTALEIVDSALTPLTAILYNDIYKTKDLAILFKNKLTPLIICSNYYRHGNVLEAVQNKIALEIVPVP